MRADPPSNSAVQFANVAMHWSQHGCGGSGGEDPVVVVVDDDADIRTLLCRLLSDAGYTVATHASSAEAVRRSRPDVPGCFLLDLSLPDVDGLELYKELRTLGCRQPFLLLTGHGTVRTAVEAMRLGAVEILEKPIDRRRLLHCIGAAVRADCMRRETARRLESLTPREREILPHLVDGRLSKEIAQRLQISPRTVEVHRRNIIGKLGAENVAQLVRVVLAFGNHALFAVNDEDEEPPRTGL